MRVVCTGKCGKELMEKLGKHFSCYEWSAVSSSAQRCRKENELDSVQLVKYLFTEHRTLNLYMRTDYKGKLYLGPLALVLFINLVS